MIYTIAGWIFLVITLIVCIVFNHPKLHETAKDSHKRHLYICTGIFAVGCIVRILMLGTLPNGPTAEEALVAVQGKTLWQTGHFLGCEHLTTLLPQWSGENAGPFLSILSAPFVGVFGIDAITARIPLVLLSILSMLAMYGIGKELGGIVLGKYMLLIQAISPYFVLSTRLTVSANAAVFLIPIAFYAAVRGFRQKGWLYVGAILFACLAYTYDLFFFIAPLFIIGLMIVSVFFKRFRMHGLLAAVVGLILVYPAVLTVWINLSGGEASSLLEFIDIPKYENFNKANWLGVRMAQSDRPYTVVLNQFWNAVFCGGVMQHVAHENINPAAIAPDGFYALYAIGFPLMLLGGMELLRRLFAGIRSENERGKGTFILFGAISTAIMILLFGSVGFVDYSGTTYCYDYSSFFFFDAVLMAWGLTQIEGKSRKGSGILVGLLGLNFAFLCFFLFGGEYKRAMNVSFPDYRDASQKAYSIQGERGYKVCFTDEVYPHISPDQASEVLYLYAADADMREEGREYTAFYPPIFEELEPNEIYIIQSKDAGNWDLEAFEYYEYDRYSVVAPVKKE